jgi:hypothetical protein
MLDNRINFGSELDSFSFGDSNSLGNILPTNSSASAVIPKNLYQIAKVNICYV